MRVRLFETRRLLEEIRELRKLIKIYCLTYQNDYIL